MRRIHLLLLGFLLISCSAKSEKTPTPQIAIGTPTPLATSTSTPALQATSTIPPACFNTPTPYAASDKSMLGIWRVRHDVERKDWNCRARLWMEDWKKLRGLPETVRINGGRGTVELSPAWVKFLDSLNTQDAQRYLRKLQSGWLNYGPFPKMEQLTFGGNFVEVTRIEGSKAFIKSYNNADAPPAVTGPNTLIQSFSVVYTDGSWEMSTPVGTVYTFIIANPEDGELWIELNNLTREPEKLKENLP